MSKINWEKELGMDKEKNIKCNSEINNQDSFIEENTDEIEEPITKASKNKNKIIEESEIESTDDNSSDCTEIVTNKNKKQTVDVPANTQIVINTDSEKNKFRKELADYKNKYNSLIQEHKIAIAKLDGINDLAICSECGRYMNFSKNIHLISPGNIVDMATGNAYFECDCGAMLDEITQYTTGKVIKANDYVKLVQGDESDDLESNPEGNEPDEPYEDDEDEE